MGSSPLPLSSFPCRVATGGFSLVLSSSSSFWIQQVMGPGAALSLQLHQCHPWVSSNPSTRHLSSSKCHPSSITLLFTQYHLFIHPSILWIIISIILFLGFHHLIHPPLLCRFFVTIVSHLVTCHITPAILGIISGIGRPQASFTTVRAQLQCGCWL